MGRLHFFLAQNFKTKVLTMQKNLLYVQDESKKQHAAQGVPGNWPMKSVPSCGKYNAPSFVTDIIATIKQTEIPLNALRIYAAQCTMGKVLMS